MCSCYLLTIFCCNYVHVWMIATIEKDNNYSSKRSLKKMWWWQDTNQGLFAVVLTDYPGPLSLIMSRSINWFVLWSTVPKQEYTYGICGVDSLCFVKHQVSIFRPTFILLPPVCLSRPVTCELLKDTFIHPNILTLWLWR